MGDSAAGRAGEGIAWRLELYLGLHRSVDATAIVREALVSDLVQGMLFGQPPLESVVC